LIIFDRLPKASQIAPVYAVIVFIIYSWTTLWFFWKLPSWLSNLSIGEIFGVFAYVMATNLLESLSVLLIPVLLSLLLPKKWFYDAFAIRGTALVLLLLAYAIFLTNQIRHEDGYPKSLLVWSIFVIFAIAFLVYVFGKIPIVCKILEFLSDRSVIFLYLSIPISVISLVVVIFRNLR
jgi:hypothetical protein